MKIFFLNLIDSLTGASPAGTFAHSADRDWENDEVIWDSNIVGKCFSSYKWGESNVFNFF